MPCADQSPFSSAASYPLSQMYWKAARMDKIPLLGRNLPAQKPVLVTLPAFKGIGTRLAEIICARMQISRSETLQDLSEARLERLALYLSSVEAPPRNRIAWPTIADTPIRAEDEHLLGPQPSIPEKDPCVPLTLDTELVRETRRHLQKLFKMKTRRGIRHAKGLPVRKRRYAHRGLTARRLNKLERIS